MAKQNRDILYGIYNDETELLPAVEAAKAKHLDIHDVYSPFPVHGLDPILGLSESRLHIAGFVYGITGTILAFTFMTWVFTSDWPIIFGGKPYWSVPAFVPIIFEVTVLFAAWGMTLTFYTICGMGPGITNPIIDERTSDDKFSIAFDVTDAEASTVNELKSFFSSTKAAEVHSKVITTKAPILHEAHH
jgi:hypothetical protein